MFEIILFVVFFGADQLFKYWCHTVLVNQHGGILPIIEDYFYLLYAENHGDNVSFIRGRSMFMNIVRLLQVALILFILIKYRKKLAGITRTALVLFLAGLVGNQFNYFAQGYVVDMFILPRWSNLVFNIADIFVLISMAILFVRLAFFEGPVVIDCLMDKFGKKKTVPPQSEAKQPAEETPRQEDLSDD